MAIEYNIEISDEFSAEQSAALRRFDSIIAANALRLLFTTSNFRWQKDPQIPSGNYARLVKKFNSARILSQPIEWLMGASESDFLGKLEEYDASDRSLHIRGLERITINSSVMGGKPCIRGLRVTAGMIVHMIAAGHSRKRLLEMYPYLEPEDIEQALEFASWKVDEKDYDLAAV